MRTLLSISPPRSLLTIGRVSARVCIVLLVQAMTSGCSDEEPGATSGSPTGSTTGSGGAGGAGAGASSTTSSGAAGGSETGGGGAGASGGDAAGGGGADGAGGAGGGGSDTSEQCLSGGSGFAAWSCALGDPQLQAVTDVAVDTFGDYVFTGVGTLFDGLATQPAGGSLFPLGKKDATGTTIWGKHIACTTGYGDDIPAVTTDLTDVILAIGCEAPVELGAGDAPGVGTTILARYDAAGALVWSQRYGGNAGVALTDEGLGVWDIDVDGAGRVAMALTGVDTLDFGGGPLPEADGEDGFLVVLDSNGDLLWVRQVSGSGNDTMFSVSAASDGFVIAGTFTGTIDLGGGALTSAGSDDFYVAKLDELGNHQWSKRFGNADKQRFVRAAAAPDGNVMVVGNSTGTIDFGGGALAGSGSGVFVARLDAAGNHVHSARYGDDADFAGITVDDTGSLIVVGSFQGQLEIGAATLASVPRSAFLTRINFAGVPVGAYQAGSASNLSFARATAVAHDSTGTVFVGGAFAEGIDVGNGPLAGYGGTDAWVSRF